MRILSISRELYTLFLLFFKFSQLQNDLLRQKNPKKTFCIGCTVCFAFFPRAQKMVNISNHLGEQFFGGAPDHVVAAGRARVRVRDSGLKPNFQQVSRQTFVIQTKNDFRQKTHRKWKNFI